MPTGEPAALDGAHDIILVRHAQVGEWLHGVQPAVARIRLTQRLVGRALLGVHGAEILRKGALIDTHVPVPGHDPDPGNSILAPPRGIGPPLRVQLHE